MKTATTFSLALIAGTVAQMVTMTFHPTSVAGLGPAALDHEIRILVTVHALALFSLPVTTFGFAGLTQRLGWGRPVALFAFVVYAFSVVAIMLAAITDGLLNAIFIPQAAVATGAALDLLKAVLSYNHQVNQACAQVYVAGSSLAFISWSAALFRVGTFERVVGASGCIVGSLAILGLLSGHVRMSAHGFGMIVLLQSVWVLAVAASMLRSDRTWSTHTVPVSA